MLLDGIKLEEIGLAEVEVGGTKLTIDVLRVNNRIADTSEANKGKSTDEQNEAIVTLIQGLGFPPCSHYLAVAFADALARRVAELRDTLAKKKPAESKPS